MNILDRLSQTLQFCLCLSVLLLTGCVSATTAIQHDGAGPPEKNSTLNVSRLLTVTSLDGRPVQWSAGSGANWASVQIPEGSHTLVLNYNRNIGGAMLESHYLNDITVTYDRFKAGRTYLLVAAEGAEARGFKGMFKDLVGTMTDTVNKAFRIGIKDVTDDPNWASFSNALDWQEGVEWLPLK